MRRQRDEVAAGAEVRLGAHRLAVLGDRAFDGDVEAEAADALAAATAVLPLRDDDALVVT